MHVYMCVWAYLCMYAFMLVCMHLRLQVSGYFMQRLLKTEQRRINATLSICTYFICCPVSVLAALRVLRSASRGELLVPRDRHFSGLSFWRIALPGSDISLIDFEKFRCYCLLSRSVGFSFFCHRGCLCIWTVLVGWFVIVPDLEWSNYNWRGGQVFNRQKSLPLTYIRRTMERRRIIVSTYDIQPKHGLCADIICGDSGYLRTTFHLQFPTFSSFHLCCRNFYTADFYQAARCFHSGQRSLFTNDSTSRDVDQHQETLTTTVSPLTIWKSDLRLRWIILWTTPLINYMITITGPELPTDYTWTTPLI